MTAPMPSSSRRFVGGLIRLGLIVLAVALVVFYVKRHSHTSSARHMRMETEAQVPTTLGPGDMRIYNTDSSVDLVLTGDRILAGLSPKTVEKVKRDMAKDTNDASGLAGSIGNIVKQSVASAIGTHAAFPLADIRDIRYENGEIVVQWTDGGRHELFSSTRVNGEKASHTFAPDDAKRFVAAVRARKGLAGSGWE